MSWPCVGGYCTDWKKVGETIIAVVGGPFGCATSQISYASETSDFIDEEPKTMAKPEWLDNPKSNQIVGRSACFQGLHDATLAQSAIRDAVRRRCPGMQHLRVDVDHFGGEQKVIDIYFDLKKDFIVEAGTCIQGLRAYVLIDVAEVDRYCSSQK